MPIRVIKSPPPQRQDRLTQAEEPGFSDYATRFLRGLSQPINYMREVGEGNYLPTQAELEASGISPMEQVAALANPMDHIYATLAAAGIVDDSNLEQNSYAALLGLVTGSAGQRVPKALDKTVEYLREKGAKTYEEIYRALRNSDAKEVLSELSAIKDKAIDFSRHIQPITQQAYTDVVGNVPGRTTADAGDIRKAALNYMIESDPDALLNFTPQRFDDGAFNETMQKFADEYLTSFRSVRSSNPENVVKYLTDPIGTGRGGRNLGPGLYQGTKASQVKSGDEAALPGYGDHMGAIRIAPQIGGSKSSASQIIKDLQEQEFLGSPHHMDTDTRNLVHAASMFPGFQTAPHIRVSRSGTGVNLLDYSDTPQGRKSLFDKYESDYYGAKYDPFTPRGFELLPSFKDEGGKMRVNKAQPMKVMKQ